jgi:hypothetical protein
MKVTIFDGTGTAMFVQEFTGAGEKLRFDCGAEHVGRTAKYYVAEGERRFVEYFTSPFRIEQTEQWIELEVSEELIEKIS